MTESKTKQLKDEYLKVVKNFRDVKPGDIKTEYLFQMPDYLGLFPLINDEGRYEPIIIAGRYFFEVDKKKRAACLAHEIGHHYRCKDYTSKALQRVTQHYSEIPCYMEHHADVLGHRMERLRKWSLAYEIYADNKAVEAGYGKPLLSFLQKIISEYYEFLPFIAKSTSKDRIKNLEEKISQR